MKTISYNRIDAPESDYLYIATSQLPDAGNGLFTAIDIYKDEMAATFDGEIVTQLVAKQRADAGHDKYFINMPNGTIMDSMPVECFAKYANDADGSSATTFSNNTKIAFDDEGRVGIIATRKIKSGQELFCGYGKKYWERHGK